MGGSARLAPKPCPDVLLRAFRGKLHRARTAPYEEVSGWTRFKALPLEKYGLGAALAAHHTHGLVLHGLHLRIDAGSCPIAKTVADDLGQMPHELVVIFEPVVLDACDLAVIRDADQQIAALGIQERGDG